MCQLRNCNPTVSMNFRAVWSFCSHAKGCIPVTGNGSLNSKVIASAGIRLPGHPAAHQNGSYEMLMLLGDPISLSEFMGTNLWTGLLLWTLIYCSDYYLTLACARMYRNRVSQTIAFEGSYEITPYYQQDVDGLRKWSPRFLRMLVRSLVMLSLMWWCSMQLREPGFYLFLLGALILVQVPTHARHLKNFFFFRDLIRTGGVRGRIEYPRPLTLRLSATEFLIWTALFIGLFLLTREWFVLGGAAQCAVVAVKHRRLADQHVAKAAAAAEASAAV